MGHYTWQGGHNIHLGVLWPSDKTNVETQFYHAFKIIMEFIFNSLQDKPKTVNRNKLSFRRRCIPTPDQGVLESKEDSYINDAIKTERRRTKYKDTLLLPYNAQDDPLCRDYFQRKDIQVLLVRTTPTSSSMTSSLTSSMTPISLPRLYTSEAPSVSFSVIYVGNFCADFAVFFLT